MTLEDVINMKPGAKLRGPDGWRGEFLHTTPNGRVRIRWANSRRTLEGNYKLSDPLWAEAALEDEL